MPKLNIDIVYCSPESISIGTGIIEHLPARWEVYATIQDGNAMPLTQCKWFACKPTRKQMKAHMADVYAHWALYCMNEPELIQHKLL